MRLRWPVLLRAALCATLLVVRAAEPRYSYVAAVYEHRVELNPNPRETLGRRAALEHAQKNLDVLEEQAGRAAQQIIVFPEDAIQGFNFTRASIASYLETVPDPGLVTWCPCAEPTRFPDTEILQRLSCIARRNRLYLVANMAGRQPCDPTTDAHCPSDGRYQFNTDVVFSDDGALVARYHKQNLYFEAAFDAPRAAELVTFSTPFAGRFGVLTCFDLLFRAPAVALVEELGVRQLVYPTAWMNQLPLLSAVQIQRSFSYGAGVTLLAANIRAADLGMTGSGVYTPWHAVYHHDAAGETGRLLVGTVPVLDPAMMGEGVENPGSAVAPFSGRVRQGSDGSHDGWHATGWHFKSQGGSCGQEPPVFTSTMMYDNFTLSPLQGVRGNLSICHGTLCCHLLFRRSAASQEELYALGVFQGLHVVHGVYFLEVCALVRCAGTDFASCGEEIDHSRSLIDFRLEGNFSSRHIFPGILGSGMVLDVPDESGRGTDGQFYMSRAGMTTGLVTAVLYSRVYEKDGE
ncbi:biotinidase isoform X2 [Denticeps clupeoides]|uniref:biotinidase isoform X2 n=1 Tax=Denticeps clupeoides TaxID=299321 RepID=UPI0010A4C8DD|nr:biotinidase isoform X2 [Denticeps clupeoides]